MIQRITLYLPIILFLFSDAAYSSGTINDVNSIVKLMDSYEKRIDSIKLKYSYETKFAIDEEGNRELVKGTYAQKKSEGYILLDERWQVGKTWDNDKDGMGIARSYNGEITRYFEHNKNAVGYHMAALDKIHKPEDYNRSRNNPYYRVWGNNYKHRFVDRLNDPNGMATIQGEEIVDGLKTIKINFKAEEGILDFYLWLLPERNFLPIKCIINHKELEGKLLEMHWSEFKEFAGCIWYPMKIDMYNRDLKEPITITIEEMDISPLTKEDFEFEFPPNTHVTDDIAGISYLTSEPEDKTDK